jgi:hypothetical protein
LSSATRRRRGRRWGSTCTIAPSRSATSGCPYILEVVERGADPPRFWGLVVVVDDPGAVPRAGPPKNAVQPRRRIATVKGLGTALAVMSRRV